MHAFSQMSAKFTDDHSDTDSMNLKLVWVCHVFYDWLLRPGSGAVYYDRPVCLSVCPCVCVCNLPCLSASMCLEPLNRSSRNFVCGSCVPVARSSSGSIALLLRTMSTIIQSRIALSSPDFVLIRHYHDCFLAM